MVKEKTEIDDEEAEEMARRFMTSDEDMLQALDPGEWQEFVTSKLFNERGYLPSRTQYDFLERGRQVFRGKMEIPELRIETLQEWITSRPRVAPFLALWMKAFSPLRKFARRILGKEVK